MIGRQEKIGKHLTADEAENVVKLIETAGQNASREVFKRWLMQHECHADVTVIDGKTYRFIVAKRDRAGLNVSQNLFSVYPDWLIVNLAG